MIRKNPVGSSPTPPTLLMSRIDLFVDIRGHVEIQSEELVAVPSLINH